MSNVRPLRPPPSDLARQLRALADDVDAGKIGELVAGYVLNGQYEFLYGCSLSDALLISTLLQRRCVDRMQA